MAATGSPSHPPQQHDDDEGLHNQDPNPTESQEAEQPPHSETLVTPDLPNPLQLPLVHQQVENSQQSDKDENTLLIVDEDDQQLLQKKDHQSGTTRSTLPEPIILTDDTNNTSPPPLSSPINPQRRLNKRKKPASRNIQKRKKPTKKVQNLTEIIKPIPFIPKKTLDFRKHEEILKRLGLYDFSKIELDHSIRSDLLVQLIVGYDSKKRCSYVNGYRINVNRAVLARALKLPAPKQEKGSSSIEEVDLDSEVFSDDAIVFIEDFVSNWMLLHEDSWVMPTEILNWTRCIKDGHPEKMDSASLIWYMVEKELTQGDKLVDCYYASHLQYLIRSQRDCVFKEEDDGVPDDCVAEDAEENAKAEDEKEEKEGVADAGEEDVKAEEEKGEKDSAVADDGEEIVKAEDDKGEKESVVADDGEEIVKAEEEKEEKEEEEEKEGKEGKEEKEEQFSVVQEHDIKLNLGLEMEEGLHEEVKEDDEAMVDASEHKEEDEEEEDEVDEQGGWLLDGRNDLSGHFLQRCQSSDLNSYEERKTEEVEDEQIEQVEDEDEEEDGREKGEEGFDMEANDDLLDRDGLTGNFLQGVETSHIPFGSQGEFRSQGDFRRMSAMDLFGPRDGAFISGDPSFFGNGGKRVMEVHHLDRNSKRLKTDEMWDQKPTDFGMCMDQIQQLAEQAKMMYASKEQSYENSQFNQQLAMNQLQERQNYLEMIIKSKDEELEKKQVEVFRLERELYLMGDLLAGYRKALVDTRFKFSEYRNRFSLHEEPLYKDAGPGGLVLSTRELEKQRLKQEEDNARLRVLAKNLEEEYDYKFRMHEDRVLMMVDKLVSIENEVKKLKEISTQRKETQKFRDEQELSVEPEENKKSLDGRKLSTEPEEDKKSLDEQNLSAEPEENQKLLGEQNLSTEPEENQKSLDEQNLSAKPEVNEKSPDEHNLSPEPEEDDMSLESQKLSAEPEESQKLPDENLPAEPEESQYSLDSLKFSAESQMLLDENLPAKPEESQYSLDSPKLSAEPEEDQKSLNEQELPAVCEEDQNSPTILNEQELSAEPEAKPTSHDEVLGNDTIAESVPLDADESKETGGSED